VADSAAFIRKKVIKTIKKLSKVIVLNHIVPSWSGLLPFLPFGLDKSHLLSYNNHTSFLE